MSRVYKTDEFGLPYFGEGYPALPALRVIPEYHKPAATTKENVLRVLEHEKVCRAWVDGKQIQARDMSVVGNWVDTGNHSAGLSFVLPPSHYRIKPVQIKRFGVVNCTPCTPGDAPYYIADFPTLERARDYCLRNKDNRDLRIVEMVGEVQP